MSLIQNNYSLTSSGATRTCSFATLPATGNSVIVVGNGYGSGTQYVNALTDNQGNTYTQLQVSGPGAASIAVAVVIWWCPAIGASTGTFTLTGTLSGGGSGETLCLQIMEVSGLTATDVGTNNYDNGTNTVGATLTNGSANTNANDFVVASLAGGNSATSAPSTGYTFLDASGFPTAYKTVSAIETTSVTFNWSGTASWNAVLQTFKGTGSNTAPVAWVT